MSPEEYQRMAQVFESARTLPKHNRSAYVRQQFSDNEELYLKVMQLLRHNDTPQLNLDTPKIVEQLRHELTSQNEVNHPDHINDYKILDVLGSGGMGIVYRAQQSNPQREVALKVSRHSGLSAIGIRRFETESNALGLLKHPGVAQIYEAGIWKTERDGSIPFFAMELIEGNSLTDYAARHKLTVRMKLQLLADICEAVQHAHQKGVIHRDLKPTNILVVNPDTETSFGQPKILDFGVARLIDPQHHGSNATLAGQLIGTLPYMSPEQLDGSHSNIDTRSDIYALGVILFELLTGELPIGIDGEAITHVLCKKLEGKIPQLRRYDKSFAGDIEAIVTMAMEPDPPDRYQSAAEFRADLMRYLNNEPVAARPPTLQYQVLKFAKRHRAFVIASSVALLAIIVALVGTTWGLVSASRARSEIEKSLTEATRQQRIAAQVNAFLNEDILAQADPRSNPTDITVREAVKIASTRLGDRFVDEPLTRAGILLALGDTLLTLADYESAERHLQESYDLRQEALGINHAETIKSAASLAIAYRYQNKKDEAIALNERALAACRKLLPYDHPECMAFVNNLAALYGDQGRFEEALAASEQVANAMRKGAPGSEQLVGCLVNLSLDYRNNHREKEALRVLNEAFDICKKHLNEKHPYVSYITNCRGVIQLDRGQFDDAEKAFRDTLSLRRAVFPSGHPQILATELNLVRLLLEVEKLAEAEPIIHRLLAAYEEKHGPDHDLTIYAREALCIWLTLSNRPREAIPHGKHALMIRSRDLGAVHPITRTTKRVLAEAYFKNGNLPEAEQLLREAIDQYPPSDVGAKAARIRIVTQLGRVLIESERFDAAESAMKEFVEGENNNDSHHWRVFPMYATYGAILARTGDQNDARSYLEMAESHLSSLFGEKHSEVIAVRRTIASLSSSRD